MQRVTAARNEIGPLLDQLIHQLDNEGSATQRACFARIRRSLLRARHDTELTLPIVALSSASSLGFKFSSDADALIARILEKADALARELDFAAPRVH